MPYRIEAHLKNPSPEDRDNASVANFFDGDVLEKTFETEQEAEDAANAAYLGGDPYGLKAYWEIVEIEDDE